MRQLVTRLWEDGLWYPYLMALHLRRRTSKNKSHCSKVKKKLSSSLTEMNRGVKRLKMQRQYSRLAKSRLPAYKAIMTRQRRYKLTMLKRFERLYGTLNRLDLMALLMEKRYLSWLPRLKPRSITSTHLKDSTRNYTGSGTENLSRLLQALDPVKHQSCVTLQLTYYKRGNQLASWNLKQVTDEPHLDWCPQL